MTDSKIKTILSGIQPTGNLHLGNYLGAIKRWVNLHNSSRCLFCVVDLHALTAWPKLGDLSNTTREVVAGMIASGISSKESTIFIQSHVPEHTELAWVLSCVTRIGWLNRMTQFKDKAGKNREQVSSGLMVYPNLMAADILLYKATHVPTGEDQKQHIELTRDIAQKFNLDTGVEVFPLPEPIIHGPGTRVMSLRDGKKKMSKSDISDMTRLNLIDSDDLIKDKIKKAKTDSGGFPLNREDLDLRPEIKNLINIYSALSGDEIELILERFGALGFSDFKNELTDIIISEISPIRKVMSELLNEPKELDKVIYNGADQASTIARPVISEVYDAIGLNKRIHL
jgi:tryptophanyl-tRNA synthetase